MAIRKPRCRITPRTPGGYLDNPPVDCKLAVTYCPNPIKYEEVRIVDYILCHRSCFERVCQRKTEEDKGARRRIALLRNGQ